MPASAPPHDAAAHPRPLSARELVARLEAAHAHEEAAAAAAAAPAETAVAADTIELTAVHDAPPYEPEAAQPRRFTARGGEWLARVAGRGTGGTGRVAVAHIGAIRFSPASEPERIAAEVIAPHARLDDLYDDELAELLERGLRWTKANG